MHERAPRRRPFTRVMAVASMRARLLRDGFPRLQMFILVSLTGLAGFAASAAMLAAGIDTMALRYTLAMGIAYSVFLLLLWLWLHTSAADYIDFPGPDGAGGAARNVDSAAADDFIGGGSFDGGGASAHVEFGVEARSVDAVGKEPLELIAQAEEGAIPLAVILLVLGLALSSLFVIWSAPVLFAEILVDALLAAGLYRRLRTLDPRHWMLAALKRTLLPFILTTLLIAGAGWAMQAHAPEASSLGEVMSGR